MKRRLLWTALGLTVLLVVVWPLLPLADASPRLQALRESRGDFQMEALELTAADHEFLGKASALRFLVTSRESGQFVLTVIDGTGNRHAVHDPSYCFTGAGWKMEERRELPTRGGLAIQADLSREGERTEALWFFDDGERQFTSPMEYWARTSARRLTLGRSGDEPLLVTLQSLPGQAVDWERTRQVLLPQLGFD